MPLRSLGGYYDKIDRRALVKGTIIFAALACSAFAAQGMEISPLPIPSGSWSMLHVVRSQNGSQKSADFLLNSPAGPLDGHLMADPDAGTFLATLSLRGASSPLDLSLTSVSADPDPQALSLVIVFGELGAVEYRVTPLEASVVSSSIHDCGAASSYPTFVAMTEMFPIALQGLQSASIAQVPATIDMLVFFGTLAARLDHDCEGAQGPLLFGCTHLTYEDDCKWCCDAFLGFVGGAVTGACGAGAALLCSPGLPAALACGALAGAACGSAAHLAKKNCDLECDALPEKPGPGESCGRGGSCQDMCSGDQQPIGGTCRTGLVCCGDVGGGLP